jgi:hypothetical protein
MARRAHRRNNRECVVNLSSPAQALNSFGSFPTGVGVSLRSLRSFAAIPGLPFLCLLAAISLAGRISR